MFPPADWTVAGTTAQCRSIWGRGTTLRPDWIPTEFGTRHVARFSRAPSSTSQIILSYGLSDPWHTGGIVWPLEADEELNDSTLVVAIPGGTHCADMAAPDRDDTEAMLHARARIKARLLSWLKQW